MAEDRKARLAALAAKAGRTNNNENEQQQNDDGTSQTKKELKFRNYTPKDAKLDSTTDDKDVEIGDDEGRHMNKRSKTNHGDNNDNDDVKTKPKTELEKALLEAKVDAALLIKQQQEDAGNTEAAEVTAIAPKKVNWDLKRDIQKKLNRLEKRTQKAIVELLRERLEREAEEQGEDEDEDLD